MTGRQSRLSSRAVVSELNTKPFKMIIGHPTQFPAFHLFFAPSPLFQIWHSVSPIWLGGLTDVFRVIRGKSRFLFGWVCDGDIFLITSANQEPRSGRPNSRTPLLRTLFGRPRGFQAHSEFGISESWLIKQNLLKELEFCLNLQKLPRYVV